MILITTIVLAYYFPRFRRFLLGENDELVSAPVSSLPTPFKLGFDHVPAPWQLCISSGILSPPQYSPPYLASDYNLSLLSIARVFLLVHPV